MYMDASVIAGIVLVAIMIGASIYGAVLIRRAIKRDAERDR